VLVGKISTVVLSKLFGVLEFVKNGSMSWRGKSVTLLLHDWVPGHEVPEFL
jgi:hypothetical protein